MSPRTDPHPREGARGGPRPPTVKQVYALAAALCEKAGEEFPSTRADASALIERLRTELGHPAPRREDSSPTGLRGG